MAGTRGVVEDEMLLGVLGVVLVEVEGVAERVLEGVVGALLAGDSEGDVDVTATTGICVGVLGVLGDVAVVGGAAVVAFDGGVVEGIALDGVLGVLGEVDAVTTGGAASGTTAAAAVKDDAFCIPFGASLPSSDVDNGDADDVGDFPNFVNIVESIEFRLCMNLDRFKIGLAALPGPGSGVVGRAADDPSGTANEGAASLVNVEGIFSWDDEVGRTGCGGGVVGRGR